MFTPGDRIHLHDGRTVRARKDGTVPKRKRKTSERAAVRGFIRGALVDCVTGHEQVGDWHENIITEYGHNEIVRNFAGLAASSPASYWGVGYHSITDSSKFSTELGISGSEFGLVSTGASSINRAAISAALSGTWTLSQSFQYASSHLSHAGTVNCIAQYGNSSIGAGTAMSLATFASSTKGSTQALNVTYNWAFGT